MKIVKKLTKKITKLKKEIKKRRRRRITNTSTIVEEFDSVEVCGSADIRLMGNGVIKSDIAFKCEVKNKVLEITDSNENTLIIKNGNSTFYNGILRGSQISVGNNNIQSMTIRNGVITINGRGKSTPHTHSEKDGDDAHKMWKSLLKPTGEIEYSVGGSGGITIEDDWWLTGDGCDYLNLSVSGAGRINITTVTMIKYPIRASVSGMGRIKGIRAGRSIKANVSGMGSIWGTTAKKCRVRQNVSGMGNINLNKQ